ncbi:LAMI_0H12816g1_1 [Lachancea mirantina]|uniref:LAMI_0H12816g1_1 n=1 Tax=Lachancea mirantina TaxID=1230905 RepID=A0A1G4KI05_9SACH|nr:LAMI_0H12816g1_1 [Lachancea mirantina]
MDRSVYEACSDLITIAGRKASADEILAQKIGNLVPIPFKSREDLEAVSRQDKKEGVYTGELIPDMDLQVLHYFATQLIVQRYPHLINCFEETGLLTLGLLVEELVASYLRNEEEVDGAGVAAIEKHVNYRDSPSNI